MNSVKTVVFLIDGSYDGDPQEAARAAAEDGCATFLCTGGTADDFVRLAETSDEICVLGSGTDLSRDTVSCLSYAVRHGKPVTFAAYDPDLVCPCCGAGLLTEKGAYEICPVCGWEDDPVQRRDPDFAGGANRLSLCEARKKLTEEETDEAYM